LAQAALGSFAQHRESAVQAGALMEPIARVRSLAWVSLLSCLAVAVAEENHTAPAQKAWGSCQAFGCSNDYRPHQSCQCNEKCEGYGNCCNDFRACSGSCQSFGCPTDFQANRVCQCNSQCEAFGNCCADYKACKASPVQSPAKPQSPVAQRGQGASCPGAIELRGHGSMQLSNAYWNKPWDPAGEVRLQNGAIEVFMKGRTYFSDVCQPGEFSNGHYSSLQLLGKRMRWTTDVSNAECGCNAAVYLASLPQNQEVSGCDDYYCDANSVCGVRCTEIDLQEANKHAFHSVLHLAQDGSGKGSGYGGGSTWNSHRDWTRQEYGPGGRCIDTRRPFQVEVGFPTDSRGRLRALTTRLSQSGGRCDLSAEISAESYQFGGSSSVEELTQALTRGMTPIVSYWSAENMLWMDGKGADGLGPCARDEPQRCGDFARFSDFAVENLWERLI